MKKLGEDVAEVLEYVPASFRVIPRSPEARLCGMIGQRARPSVDLFAAKAEFEAHDPYALKSRYEILVQIPHKSILFQQLALMAFIGNRRSMENLGSMLPRRFDAASRVPPRPVQSH